MAAFGLIALVGLGETVNAQGNRRNEDRQERRLEKQREKIEKQQTKIAQQRVRLDRQRQADWTRRNSEVWRGSHRSNTTGVYSVNVNSNTNRYRILRNGSYYNTDYRGAELLRQAVNDGYRKGFEVGRRDRSGNRRIGWSDSNVYRTGTVGYRDHVNRGQYQYYFRQGFQRGYQDGSNSRFQDGYNGEYEYGYYDNGSMNILDKILDTVLNIQTY